MDSLETYDIYLSSITTCSHAAGYDINVNTRKLTQAQFTPRHVDRDPKTTTQGVSDADEDIKEEEEKIRDI